MLTKAFFILLRDWFDLLSDLSDHLLKKKATGLPNLSYFCLILSHFHQGYPTFSPLCPTLLRFLSYPTFGGQVNLTPGARPVPVRLKVERKAVDIISVHWERELVDPLIMALKVEVNNDIWINL